MTKRYRAPKAKHGQLKICWGKMPHENEDICTAWGDGIHSSDARLLHNVFSTPRNRYMSTLQDPSLVEELAKRGYDLTTIKFSIEKIKQM